MTSYLRGEKFSGKYDEVPDPYFAAPGSTQGFDLVSGLTGANSLCRFLHPTACLQSRCADTPSWHYMPAVWAEPWRCKAAHAMGP